MVYVRPDIVVVHDRVATLAATYTKQLRWHFTNQPEVHGIGFVDSTGSSKLYGRTISDVDVASRVRAFNSRDAEGNVVNPAGYSERPFYELITESVAPVSDLTYTTAFQTAPASTSEMLDTSRVVCAGGAVEGASIGGSLVLFGRDGKLDPAIDTISCSLSGPLPSMAVIVDLQPGRTYRIELNGRLQLVAANEYGTIATMAFGNRAPVLDNSGAPYLISPAGSRLPPGLTNGILVSDLLARGAGGNPIIDSDPGARRGIAVTSIDNTFGQWQFTLADSPREADWINFETAGPISDASALLLPADSTARLRYVTGRMPHHAAGVDVLPLESRLVRGLTFRA